MMVLFFYWGKFTFIIVNKKDHVYLHIFCFIMVDGTIYVSDFGLTETFLKNVKLHICGKCIYVHFLV